MSTNVAHGRHVWNDPTVCPFCGGHVADGGPGFMDHVDDSPACMAAFDVWREQVAGDVGGEWSG